MDTWFLRNKWQEGTTTIVLTTPHTMNRRTQPRQQETTTPHTGIRETRQTCTKN
jgi:hypothetical protein